MKKRKMRLKNYISAIAFPLILLLVSNQVEQFLQSEPVIETIQNSILLPFPAETVFHHVKSMDTLDASKPLGIKLGLPVPYKCTIEHEGVGAKRYCHFDNGQIIAQITRYEPGVALEMEVIDYSLTGREWFKFQDATYLLEDKDGGTKITRTSSYKSHLYPRVYWRPLEHWGIHQEHKFVLASLEKNLRDLE